MRRALRRLWIGLRLRVLLALLLVALPVVACRAPRSADDALTQAATGYALAVRALAAADAVTVAWLDALDVPTEAELATGARVIEALTDARAALTAARAALDAGEDALPRVREALALLRYLEELAPDSALASALDAVEAVIGGTP
ncbi:MAG: hypothetical protein M0R37_13955 [Bacteroidales bacterium]|nr:hypothetical protein [Bacteroidales bacterium]